MLIAHLYTGPRKGVIVEIENAKLSTPQKYLNAAIAKAFNRATESNLPINEVIDKHFVNYYSNMKFRDDENFDLEYDMAIYSLNHKKSDYIFVKENISVAEIDSKQYDRVVSIDFETANSKRSSVCSIGFVVEEQGEIIKEEEILVNPMVEFSKNNIRVHGITPLDVQDAPTWEIAWQEVEQYISPTTLVIAHNLRSMELSCIRQECERYNMELPTFAKIKGHNKMAYDTLKIAKETLKNLGNYRLDTLTEIFDIELEHHNALSDARACLQLFNSLIGCAEYSDSEGNELENKLKPTSNKPKYSKSYAGILKANVDVFDENNELFNKKVVFTGEFDSISRKDASQSVLDVGGVLANNSVTKDTNYVVVGNISYKDLTPETYSGKLKKAHKYINDGIDIKIISEDEFIGFINKNTEDAY